MRIVFGGRKAAQALRAYIRKWRTGFFSNAIAPSKRKCKFVRHLLVMATGLIIPRAEPALSAQNQVFPKCSLAVSLDLISANT